MSRKSARELIFKMLFAIDVGGNTIDEASQIVLARPMKEDQKRYILNQINGILKNQVMIDQIINKYSTDWELERLAATDRNILRIAIFEMLFCGDIPISVSINEAIEIAKRYCEQKSYKFINGLLGSVARENKPNE
ncbi:MAG: transcription antitermination factor NusB [Thermoanaerobacterales bacterium]|nr:transcription antitermination factor NusB [Thermoanaerobacterales bacterium]